MVKLKLYLLIGFLLLNSKYIFAHHKVYSPRVEDERLSLEWRGHFDKDKSEKKNKVYHQVIESEYSWNNFWQTEIELHYSDDEDKSLDWIKTEFQNQIQIIDFTNFASALYFSYNFISVGDKADEVEYKSLNEIKFKKFKLITNFIFEKQIGKNATGSTEFTLSNYLFFEKPIFNNYKIGLIGFSELGEISKISTFNTQEHQYGLIFEKEFGIDDYEFEISIGYLKGFTKSSSDHSLLWNTEFEF